MSMSHPGLRTWQVFTHTSRCFPYSISCGRAPGVSLRARCASTKPPTPRQPVRSKQRAPPAARQSEQKHRITEDAPPPKKRRRILRFFGGSFVLAVAFVAFTETGRNAYKGAERTGRVANTLTRCIIEYVCHSPIHGSTQLTDPATGAPSPAKTISRPPNTT